MRHVLISFLSVIVLVFSLTALPSVSAAATFADGTYDVSYEIKEAGSNNTSIADGYFKKPAKLIIENGNNYVHLTVTSSEWIKSLSGPFGAATNVSEDAANNSRVIKLQVGDVSQPVDLKMHIVVPEDIAGMEYDNHHSATAVFDVSNVPLKSETSGGGTSGTSGSDDSSGTTGTVQPEDNPKTGEESHIILYAGLLVGSIAVLFLMRKFRTARN